MRMMCRLIVLIALLEGWLTLDTRAQQRDTSRAGNAQVAEIMKSFPSRGVMADDSQPTPPNWDSTA